MKKMNRLGFFLVETMVVIAIVGVVLTFLFKTFSNLYARFNTSEYYNTVDTINASSYVKQYIDKLNIDYEDLLNGEPYIEITGNNELINGYYDLLKTKLNITNIYLINIQTFFQDENNLNDFNINFRGYLKTLSKDNAQYKIVVINTNSEFGSVSAFDYYLTLVGDPDDEYVTYVPLDPLNGNFVDPGYVAKDNDGNNLETIITGVVTTNIAGTYYLNYSTGAITLRRKVIVYKDIYNFDYTGNYQTFVAPVDGKYQIELWGAEGGNGILYGGKGGYTKGSIYLMAGTKLYVYVGGAGYTNGKGGYNGGGYALLASDNYGGGGATDVRLVDGKWNNLSSLRSRIIVAAGGGGAFTPLDLYVSAGVKGGSAGGLTGFDADIYTAGMEGHGGTQTNGGLKGITTGRSPGTDGAFGVGGTGAPSLGGPTVSGGSGGGGGYYGGGSGEACAGSCGAGGGGGSSFISGVTGCDAVKSDGTHAGQPNHYSGYKFTNTQLIDGKTSMLNPRGAGNITGNNGAGYARITLLGINSNNDLQKVRYIYNQINGSNVNAGNHWVEVQAFDLTGANVALGKPVTGSSTYMPTHSPYTILTDGEIISNPYAQSNLYGLQYIVIDLGAEYDLSSIRLWHYYADKRIYNENEVRVAGEDLVYRTVNNTNYPESSDGLIIRPTPTN